MLEGSPVYDMYETCPGCEEHGKQVYEATIIHQNAITRSNDATRAVAAQAAAEGRLPSAAFSAAAVTAAAAAADSTMTGDSSSMLDTDDLDVGNGNGDAAAAAAAALMDGDVSLRMASLLAEQAAAQADRDRAKSKMLAAIEARKRHEDRAHPAGPSCVC
jgi:hypothetical protein